MPSEPRSALLARLAPIALAIGALTMPTTAPRASAQQTTKPTGTISTVTRLPTPGPVVARQLANGAIEVRWKAIVGAASYQVTRSVPPAPAQVAANPTDTVYVDTNVQAGSAYYYVVAAVDSAGGIGLKSGSQPVTATTSSTASSLMAGGATTGGTSGGGTTGGTSTPSGPTLVAPVNISVDTPYPNAIVYFSFTQDGMAYRVERGIISTTGSAPSWSVVQVTGPRPCCWFSSADRPPVVPGQGVVYRVSTVDPTMLSRASAPTTAPIVRPGGATPVNVDQTTWSVFNTSAYDKTYPVGSLISLGVGDHEMSLDPTVVDVDATGTVRAKKPGVAWVISGFTLPSGRPDLRAYRITVTP